MEMVRAQCADGDLSDAHLLRACVCVYPFYIVFATSFFLVYGFREKKTSPTAAAGLQFRSSK